MVIQLLSERQLFGEVYRQLHPDAEHQGVPFSGVLVAPSVPTHLLAPQVRLPGDVDVLAIPYEREHLLLGQALAMEIKVVRASFAKQGKSPNEFGFSQACGLLDIGVPYAALVHLVVSDASPPERWETKHRVRVLDNEGHVSEPEEIQVDMLPSKLIDRGFHRLLANSKEPTVGLACAYLGDLTDARRGMWFPSGRHAAWNPKATSACLQRLAEVYETYADRFLATPRYDDGPHFSHVPDPEYGHRGRTPG